MAKIDALEDKISKLPVGYVTKKTINGKAYFYHQWLENGKTKSRILQKDQVEALKEKIELRKALTKQLKALNQTAPKKTQTSELADLTANATYGQSLKDFMQSAVGLKTRDCISVLDRFIKSKPQDKVCVIYGLRRTGKTTLLKHEMLSFDKTQLEQTVYIKARQTDTVSSMNQDIKALKERGFKYFFIDEITLIEDFIDNAAILSDVYAPQGLKFVLSGTDSLGFYFAESDELYDRAVMIHTTFIPFREHARLLGINDIDEYIRFGGTLKAGELAFENSEINDEEASFRDDESTRRYIDTAICKNIQHSLRCYQNGRYFRHLRELYDADELTNAINRIIESENHDFTVEVITQLFESHDLGSAAQLLRKARDEKKRTDVLDRIDKTQILLTLKKILKIKEKKEQAVGVGKEHVTEIKQYLKRLDLIDELEIETMTGASKPLSYTIFTQPGMRFCQAQALVYSLMKDKQIASLDERESKLITEKIIDGVLGHMLEDIVIYETKKVLAPSKTKNYKQVYKIRFDAGEYDMLIWNSESNTCEIYEIKHSAERIPFQYRHLVDKEKNKITERRFGKIIKRCVLYKGQAAAEKNGIVYQNVEEYLKSLG